MILVLFTKAILASYNQQHFTSEPVYSILEEILIRPLSTNVFYTNPSQKTNLVSQENQHPHFNDDFCFKETLPYGLSNQNNLNLVSLIKNQERDLEFSAETQWILNLNNTILKEIETKKKPFDLKRILSCKNTLQKSILNYPTDTTFDMKKAFVHYFITVLYSYSELTLDENWLFDMKIIYSSCDSFNELENGLKDFIETINFRKDIISLDYISLKLFCMSCFPGFVNFKNIFPTNSSVDFTLIRERINLFISHLYYINQNSQFLDLISRFSLVFNSEHYCILSPVSVFRTNILEKLCNIYLNKFAFFEIFSLLSYMKNNFIPFESYKKIEGTIIFIILLNSFYSNYCEYYKNVVIKSHDFTSQESFDNFKGFKALFNDKNSILEKSFHFPVNMILNSMYLSKIFFILLIFNLKLEYPHFLRCNMFLYVIHLKVFYFPDKDLSEIYNSISIEEKSFFGVSDIDIDSLVNFKD